MINLMFIALSPLSTGDMTIAVEFAAQLSSKKYNICFVVSSENKRYIEQRGLQGFGITFGLPKVNFEQLCEIIDLFRPHYFVAADIYTLELSQTWSGFGFHDIQRRYQIPFITFDQYEWNSTNHVLDLYGLDYRKFPNLINQCAFAINNCPLNKFVVDSPISTSVRLFGDNPRLRWYGSGGAAGDVRQYVKQKIIVIVNSRWEYVNITNSARLRQMITLMPRLIHDHIAAINCPISIMHVGPVPWTISVASHITYKHIHKLPPKDFEKLLLSCDLFITTNIVSVTLSKAVCNGVPSVVIQNSKILNFYHLSNLGASVPSWLQALSEHVSVVYPFRVFPWGWYEFLTPVLNDNPYRDCFAEVQLFKRKSLTNTLQHLLYDPSTITTLRQRQEEYTQQMLRLPSPEEVLAKIEQTISPIQSVL